jgi:hypothetical protein
MYVLLYYGHFYFYLQYIICNDILTLNNGYFYRAKVSIASSTIQCYWPYNAPKGILRIRNIRRDRALRIRNIRRNRALRIRNIRRDGLKDW